MKVAQTVGATLAKLGVSEVFGLLRSGNFAVTNALVASGAGLVASRHDAGAVTLADEYARVSGRPGVCTIHQGPGMTNAMTGLTEAAKSRTPLLLLVADTAGAPSARTSGSTSRAWSGQWERSQNSSTASHGGC